MKLNRFSKCQGRKQRREEGIQRNATANKRRIKRETTKVLVKVKLCANVITKAQENYATHSRE